jgi:glutamate-1-semialdehyde 2,1-aminomutase
VWICAIREDIFLWRFEKMASYLDTYRQKTPQSEKLFERAKEVLPGGVCHTPHYLSPYPFYIKGAKGSKLWDRDGNEYVDLWMGNFTHILGHRPDLIVEAIEKQVKEGIHWGLAYEKQVEWAEMIRELIPCAEMVRFCCSGTEATMYAVRLARACTGRGVVLKMAGGWHGANSDLMVDIKWPYDQPEGLGLSPDSQTLTKTLPYNDLDRSREVIRQIGKNLAAIILEPIIGEGGFVPASPDYLKMLRHETEKLGALLILDEIISGFRISLNGAQGRFGITPDLTTLGKIVGGGLPVGVVAGKKDLLEKTSPARKVHKREKILIGGGTFSSHPLTAAAGLAMLRHLKDHAEEIYPLLEAKGKKAREGIQKMFDREGVNALVTGIGSLFQTHFLREEKKGLTLDSPQAIYQFTDVDKREGEYRIRMLNKGVHVIHGGGALSISHSEEDIERIVEAAGEAAREMKREG